jgi:hypothetical protein
MISQYFVRNDYIYLHRMIVMIASAVLVGSPALLHQQGNPAAGDSLPPVQRGGNCYPGYTGYKAFGKH